jgi:hypothetical protein
MDGHRTVRTVCRVLTSAWIAAALAALPSCGNESGGGPEPEMEPVTAEEREMVVERVSELLSEYYVFVDVAEECVERINAELREGAYDDITRPNLFASALNEDLQGVSGDRHLKVVALFGVTEGDDLSVALDELDHQHFLQRGNYGVMRVEWLRGNVGYVDLRAFSSLYVARDKLVAVMEFLSNMDAIIFDLRDEVMGGPPETVQFLASYFFDEPTLIGSAYFRADDVTEEVWTLDSVPGTRMADVPLYILTDDDVFSAGEGFSYALQALGRATVVGETTMGGAHVTRPFRIGGRFEAKIPWGRSINPTTGTNWEGVGVVPDVPADADEALDVALELAREAAEERRTAREARDVAAMEELLEEGVRAESLFEQGDAQAATSVSRDVLERGLAAGILNEGSIDDIGYHYLDRGMVEMALAVHAFNADMHPESANVYHSLAEVHVRRGDRERAVANLERCLELDPRNGWASSLLGRIDEEIARAAE